jgi:hypothetical protein
MKNYELDLIYDTIEQYLLLLLLLLLLFNSIEATSGYVCKKKYKKNKIINLETMDLDWLNILNYMRSLPNKKWTTMADEFLDITYEDAVKVKEYKHAAHAFVFAKNSNLLWNNFNQKAAIYMQMR